MTPHEKAVNAINARLERLQTSLRDAKEEASQRYLFQSIVVTVAAAEALTDYIKAVGAYAQRRHADVKQANEHAAAQHADLLKSGQALLEKLKADPGDRALRKEIERVQQTMETLQKSLRRGANALQRDVAPALAMIDQLADSVKRLADAEQIDALKRLLKTIVAHVREFYAALSTLPSHDTIDAAAWENSAASEIDQAAGFPDAYARAGFQTILAIEWMTLALSATPPQARAEAEQQGHASAAARLKEITGRLTQGGE